MHPIQTLNGFFRICFTTTCTLGTRPVNDGNWHFAAVTGDATSLRGYIDGVLDATQAADSSVIADVFRIGGSSSGYYFWGTIDQVRLYSASLTARAIKEQYYAGLTAHPPTLAATINP